MKLTFVVPVYNAALFLEECLTSLYEQNFDLSDFEVIVIDDGSTDASLLVAKKFASGRCNCRIFTQKNKGVSAVRNRGIREAKGAYVMFVDADDYIRPGVLPSLLEEAVTNDLDFIRGESMTVDRWGRRSGATGTLFSERRMYKGRIVDGTFFYKDILRGEFYSVLFLFKRAFLTGEEIYYPEGIRMCEDLFFLVQVCRKATRCVYSDVCIYVIRSHPDSAVHTMTKQKLLDFLWVLEQIRKVKTKEWKSATDRVTARSVCMILHWTVFLSVADRSAVLAALKASRFRFLPFTGNLRQKIQIGIYNLLSARALVFLKRIKRGNRSSIIEK